MTCAIGCGVLLLVAFVVVFSTGYWLVKKGEFEAESTILASGADFFIEINITEDDELLVDFLSNLSNTANEQNPVMQKFSFLKEWNEKKTRKDLQKLLPLKAEVTGTVASDDFRASVGFSLYNNLMNVVYWFFKREAAKEGRLYEHEGKTYLSIENGSDSIYMSLENSVVYVCNSEDGIRSVVSDDKWTMDSHSESRPMRGLDRDAPVYGFVVGDAISADPLREFGITDPEKLALLSPDFIERISFNLKVIDAESLESQINFLLLPSSEPALMRDLIAEITAKLEAREQPKFVCNLVETSNEFRLHVNVSGLDDAMMSNMYMNY